METIISYFRRSILVIFFLGLASGVPLALNLSSLKAFLVDQKIDIATIGFIALVTLPYSIKFLWAPIVDSTKIPFLSKIFGKRRSWILLTQFLLIFFIIILGISSNFHEINNIVIIATIIAFISATHDIAVDAYRIESVEVEDQAIAASMYIYGYRIGMLISGAFALILSESITWDKVYYFIACTISLGILAIMFGKEKIEAKSTEEFIFSRWLRNSVFEPLKDFTRHKKWYLIFLFILCFKLTDAFAGNLFLPFLLEINFTKTQIATIVKTFGLFATLFGAAIGGIMVKKFGLNRSLWFAAIAQMISNIGFYFLALIGNSQTALYIVILIENLSGGIGDVVFVAYLSSLCNVQFSATQYSLLVSIASTARSVLSSPAGVFAQIFGWHNFFLLSVLFGIPSLILLRFINIIQIKNTKIS